MRYVATELLGLNEKSAVLKDDVFERMMMSKFDMSAADLDEAVERTLDLGTARTEKLIASGDNRSPRCRRWRRGWGSGSRPGPEGSSGQ